jgi:hypothetical protein
MNIEKIKDVGAAIFAFILYTLFVFFSLTGFVSFMFALAFFIGMISGCQYAFTGFCISFGTMIVIMIIFYLLNVDEAGEWGGLF